MILVLPSLLVASAIWSFIHIHHACLSKSVCLTVNSVVPSVTSISGIPTSSMKSMSDSTASSFQLIIGTTFVYFPFINPWNLLPLLQIPRSWWGLCWRVYSSCFFCCDLHICTNSQIERWCKFTMHYAWNEEERKVWLMWCESCV
jgi:hypothetical protein